MSASHEEKRCQPCCSVQQWQGGKRLLCTTCLSCLCVGPRLGVSLARSLGEFAETGFWLEQRALVRRLESTRQSARTSSATRDTTPRRTTPRPACTVAASPSSRDCNFPVFRVTKPRRGRNSSCDPRRPWCSLRRTPGSWSNPPYASQFATGVSSRDVAPVRPRKGVKTSGNRRCW